MTLPAWTQNQWVRVLAAFLVGAVGGYGGGRWAAPTKIVEKEVVKVEYKDRVQVVEKVVEKVVQGPTKVVIKRVEVPGPPGACGPTVTVDTTITQDPVTTTTTTDTAGNSTSSAVVVQEKEKIVERDGPRLTLLGTVGLDTKNLAASPVWGGQVQVRVLGPLVLGAGFDSSLRVTAAAGVSF